MRLNEIYDRYNDRVEFFVIYTREAHPADGWQTPQNLDENIIFNEPTTEDEREKAAAACQLGMDLRMPMLLDNIDNDVEGKYVSLPMRLFLIDAGGTIVYTGDEGPRGFNADSWEEAIKTQLA